jgi:uncharacterized metal-binding protein YceD (DUF177 family)
VAFVLSHPVSVAEPPADPVAIAASSAELAALAKAYDLASVDRVEAEATVTPGSGGALQVAGRVMADIVQTCVVTLAPVPQRIDEPFSVRFAPPGRAAAPLAEVVLDPEAPDPPEPITGPNVDIGALVEEIFALAIDPYPRAPGAELPLEAREDEPEGADSPFAVLSRLARPDGEKD